MPKSQPLQRARYGAASNNSSFPERLHTGKPSFQINEKKLNFLLEQGFKVSEVSEMLGSSNIGAVRAPFLFGVVEGGGDSLAYANESEEIKYSVNEGEEIKYSVIEGEEIKYSIIEDEEIKY